MTRCGVGERGRSRSLSFAALVAALPGAMFTYRRTRTRPLLSEQPRPLTCAAVESCFHVRRRLDADGPVEWLDSGGPLISYRWGNAFVAANCGAEPLRVDLPRTGTPVYSTRELPGGMEVASVVVAADEAVVVRLDERA